MSEEINEKSCTSSCSTCSKSATCSAAKEKNENKVNEFLVQSNEYSHIKRIIGIVSGKGGVGKSTVACTLARQLNECGYRVGILDADITGPSIPRMMGIGEGCGESDAGIIPPVSSEGIPVMSMNLLLEREDDAVIWRGPVIAGIVKQFYTDVCWGELDFMLVDMPPGTGDVPLTVFQSLPVDGIVLVTSPQSLVSMIVKKAYNMAQKMDIPVLGIVENYSYYKCPDCKRIEKIFGESNIDKEAEDIGVPVLAKLPIVSRAASAADNGVGVAFEEKINIEPIVSGIYDLAIFDLDGTLTDPKVGITTCVQYALADIGIDEPDIDKLEDFIGPPLIEHFMERYNLDENTAKACAAKYRERYIPTGVYENVIYDDIEKLLKTLKDRGVKLAVASSKPQMLVEKVLDYFDIKKYFDVVCGSELDGTRAKKREVLEYALAKAKEDGIRYKSPIMIGDTKYDIIGAREVNIPCMSVSYGYGPIDELIENEPDYIVDSVMTIAQIVR